MQLHEQGIAAPSYTTLNGRYCLRIAIANHRSRQEDFDVLAKETVRLGRELVPQFSSSLHNVSVIASPRRARNDGECLGL